jgi:hypothetical protein
MKAICLVNCVEKTDPQFPAHVSVRRRNEVVTA